MKSDAVELFEHVKRTLEKEEGGVAVYVKHLSAIVARSGLTDDQIRRARAMLSEIVETNRRHVVILRELIEKLRLEPAGD